MIKEREDSNADVGEMLLPLLLAYLPFRPFVCVIALIVQYDFGNA